jgi:hypothetical protein
MQLPLKEIVLDAKDTKSVDRNCKCISGDSDPRSPE